jgi:ribose 5-phosphate isomerase A
VTDDLKRQAALAALAELPPDGVIGLGTGSTARLFIAALGELVASGRRYRCVATSEASRRQAQELGIPVLSDDGPWDIAVTVDGADEVDRALDLIKGGGGAHTREKIVNFSSRRNVIVVDASKLSPRLGERCASPAGRRTAPTPATWSTTSRAGRSPMPPRSTPRCTRSPASSRPGCSSAAPTS